MLVPNSAAGLSHVTLARSFMLCHRKHSPIPCMHGPMYKSVILTVCTAQLDGAVWDHDAVCHYD